MKQASTTDKKGQKNYESIYGNLKRVGVRMTQRQDDTVRHFGTEGHFGTATK